MCQQQKYGDFVVCEAIAKNLDVAGCRKDIPHNKGQLIESNIRKEVAKNSLLEREKDDLISRIKDYEVQIKKLNLTVELRS